MSNLSTGKERADDVFARALRETDLDASVKIIMDALEIKTGRSMESFGRFI